MGCQRDPEQFEKAKALGSRCDGWCPEGCLLVIDEYKPWEFSMCSNVTPVDWGWGTL
jgi:hypothetical protein